MASAHTLGELVDPEEPAMSINPNVIAAREQARQVDGKFGVQQHSAPEPRDVRRAHSRQRLDTYSAGQLWGQQYETVNMSVRQAAGRRGCKGRKRDQAHPWGELTPLMRLRAGAYRYRA